MNAREAQVAAIPRAIGIVGEVDKIELVDYSLSELVDFAMTNRPSVAAAALEVESARLALIEIAADAPLVSYSPWTAPHASLSGGHNASSEGAHRLRGTTYGNASAGISVDILLYDFGRNEAQARAQIERVIAAECTLLQEGFTVFEEVASAYFTLMEADALLEVAHTNEMEYALHLQQAEDKLQAGEAKRLDVTRAKLDLSQAREAVISASNLVDTTGAELMKALGIDASRGTRNTVYPPSGNALAALTRGFSMTRYGVEEAFELARTNAPSMAIARARVRAASHDVDYAIADLKPSVSASVGISWADPLWAWHWGVNAVQSVFEGYKKTAAVDKAVVKLNSAEAAVDEAEQELSLLLEKAIANRDNAVEAGRTARVSVRAASENLDMVKQQYVEGDASRVDFTDSVSDYATALGSRVTAFYKGQIAEARLFAIMGTMPEFDEDEERMVK